MGHYGKAQICLNGHVIDASFDKSAQQNNVFCEKCGEKIITQCPYCSNDIRGDYIPDIPMSPSDYNLPAYCLKCGKAFPWTESKLKSVIEMAVEAGRLNTKETRQFEECIKDIVKDTPQVKLSANRFKKVMSKVGNETASGIRDIIVDLISETTKKIIWPGL
jgi:hypothetical protein